MRIDESPMPARVAARPRDERGYPVPAITPWQDGRPQFALTSVPRSFICAVERRCSICGDLMAPGPVWRMLAGPEADAVVEAQEAGRSYLNRAPTAEAPGHRICMLYAAVTCPYLARPNARRGQPAEILGLSAERGGRRGLGGAVAAFERVDFKLGDVVMFRFAGLVEFRQHEFGSEQSPELAAELAEELAAELKAELAADPAGETAAEPARSPAPRPPVPDYLLADEAAAERRFAELRRSLPAS